MTAKELYEYKDLKKDIEMLKTELSYLQSRAYGVSSPKIDSVGTSAGGKSDSVGSCAVELAMREDAIKKLIAEAEEKRSEIAAYILEARKIDKLAASVMYERFINCKSWNRLGHELHSTGDACRMIVFRFLSKN